MTDRNTLRSTEKSRPIRIISTVLSVLGIFLFQQFASRTGSVVADLFNNESLDPDGAFMAISIHHIVQALIALIPIILLAKAFNINFGFHAGKVRTGLEAVAKMAVVLTVYMIISYVIGYSFDLIRPYNYPLNGRNVAGTLAFQLFLSGPSEEILFRALPVAVLAYMLKNISRGNSLLSSMIAAFLFSIAHINWSFTASGLLFDYDIIQLIYAFILGTVQGIVFLKTESVYYSMAIHSISNVLSVGIGYMIILFIL